MVNIEENATAIVVAMIENLPQVPKNKISTLDELNEYVTGAYKAVVEAMSAKHPSSHVASAASIGTSKKRVK